VRTQLATVAAEGSRSSDIRSAISGPISTKSPAAAASVVFRTPMKNDYSVRVSEARSKDRLHASRSKWRRNFCQNDRLARELSTQRLVNEFYAQRP
jgi:hypothetical protein